MNKKRVDNGVVYTPKPLALLAAGKLFEYRDVVRTHAQILDPCCGDGALLRQCRRIDAGVALRGIDIDSDACAVARGDGFDCTVSDLFDVTDKPACCVICNPPYVGRSNISRIVGKERFDWLKSRYRAERSGSCDLAGYVLRHILQTWRPIVSTWIVTNTISQGSTRRVGLRWALANGYQIVSALKDIKWPGAAAVVVHVVTMVDAAAVGGFVPQNRCEYVPCYQL